jgi:hypothetical protein
VGGELSVSESTRATSRRETEKKRKREETRVDVEEERVSESDESEDDVSESEKRKAEPYVGKRSLRPLGLDQSSSDHLEKVVSMSRARFPHERLYVMLGGSDKEIKGLLLDKPFKPLLFFAMLNMCNKSNLDKTLIAFWSEARRGDLSKRMANIHAIRDTCEFTSVQDVVSVLDAMVHVCVQCDFSELALKYIALRDMVNVIREGASCYSLLSLVNFLSRLLDDAQGSYERKKRTGESSPDLLYPAWSVMDLQLLWLQFCAFGGVHGSVQLQAQVQHLDSASGTGPATWQAPRPMPLAASAIAPPIFAASAFPPLNAASNMGVMSSASQQHNNQCYAGHMSAPASSSVHGANTYDHHAVCTAYQEQGPAHNLPHGKCSFCTTKAKLGIYQHCLLCNALDHGALQCPARSLAMHQRVLAEFQQHSVEIAAKKAASYERRAADGQFGGQRLHNQRGGSQSWIRVGGSSSAAGGAPASKQ